MLGKKLNYVSKRGPWSTGTVTQASHHWDDFPQSRFSGVIVAVDVIGCGNWYIESIHQGFFYKVQISKLEQRLT